MQAENSKGPVVGGNIVHTRNRKRTQEAGAQRGWRDGGGTRPGRHGNVLDLSLG